MGGKSSKENEEHRANGTRATDYGYDDDDSDDGQQGLPQCFQLIPFLPQPKKKNSTDRVLGTPIMTPPMTKRKRQRLIEAAKDNPVFLSRYNGLEKETSAFLPPRPFMSETAEVQVVEGKEAEQLMFRKYELLEVLGVGSTSTCHRCRNKWTGVDYACKVIDKNVVQERFAGMMEQFRTEIAALKQLRRHPNIISLYDVFVSDDKLWIVMELMEGGELFDYVVQKGTLTEEEASRCVRMVTSALVYMHSKNIIHRDLKPENLLLKRKPNPGLGHEDLELKVIDFGLSKCLQPTTDIAASSFLGTRGYLAPEMLQRQEYSQQIDTWALGIIVFVLLCGCLPFDDDSSQLSGDLVHKKFQLRFPRWAKNLSDSAKDLLGQLLDVNPRTRATAEQALRHPWVTGEEAPKENILASPGHLHKSPRSLRITPPPGTRPSPPTSTGPTTRSDGTKPPVGHVRRNSKDYNFGHYTGTFGLAGADVSASVQRTLLPPRTLVRKTSI